MMESYKGSWWWFLNPVRKIHTGNTVRRGKMCPEDYVNVFSTGFSLETQIENRSTVFSDGIFKALRLISRVGIRKLWGACCKTHINALLYYTAKSKRKYIMDFVLRRLSN